MTFNEAATRVLKVTHGLRQNALYYLYEAQKDFITKTKCTRKIKDYSITPASGTITLADVVGGYAIYTSNGHGRAVDNILMISDINSTYNGEQKITAVTANTFTTDLAITDGETYRVLSVTVTDGGAYSSGGSLGFSGGGGSGAIGTYTVTSNVITGTAISNKGTGYTSAPTVVPDVTDSRTWTLTLNDTSDYGTINLGDITRHDGYYVIASWEGVGGNASYLYVYAYDGSTFTYKSRYSAPFVKRVYSDGTYLYGGFDSSRVEAFSIDGSGVLSSVANTTSYAGEGGMDGDGTYIYMCAGAAVRTLTFNGSVFASVDVETTPGASVVGVTLTASYFYAVTKEGAGDTLHAYSVASGIFTHITSISIGTTNLAEYVAGSDTQIAVTVGSSGVKGFSFDGATLSATGSIDEGGNHVGLMYYGDQFYVARNLGVTMYFLDGSTFTNSQAVPNTDINTVGIYVDSNGVVTGAAGAGIRGYAYAPYQNATLAAVMEPDAIAVTGTFQHGYKVAVPSDFLNYQRVGWNGQRLDEKSQFDYQTVAGTGGYALTTGAIEGFWWLPGHFRLVPVPSASGVLRLSYTYYDTTAAPTSPIISVAYQEALIDYAIWQMFEVLHDDRKEGYMNRYIREVERVAKFYELKVNT